MKAVRMQRRKNSNHTADHQSIIMNAFIPAREVADALVACYFETFEYTYRILHAPTFQREYNRFWITPLGENPAFLAKLLCVMAIGSFHFAETNGRSSSQAISAELVSRWLHAVQHWLDAAIAKSKSIFDALQVHCLLLLARQASSINSNLIWISSGALVRTAMVMGLHRDPNAFPAMSPFHAEMRRRLWATITEIDIQASLDAGKPPSVSPGDYDCGTPSNIDDEDMSETDVALPEPKPPNTFTRSSFQTILCKSLAARIEVVRLSNSLATKTSFQELLKLSTEINKELQNLPSFFSSAQKTASTATQKAEFPAVILDLLIRRFLLAIHRQVAIMGAYDPKYHFSRIICLGSSLAILSYFGLSVDDKDRQSDKTFRIQTYCGAMFHNDFFHAAITVCLELLMGMVDLDVLGCSIQDQAMHTAMGNTNRLQTERLTAVIERALNVIKHWVSEEDGNYNKRYLLLSMALSSVKSRYSKDNALDAVSETLRTSINTCKSILLRKNEAVLTIGQGLARNVNYINLIPVNFFYRDYTYSLQICRRLPSLRTQASSMIRTLRLAHRKPSSVSWILYVASMLIIDGQKLIQFILTRCWRRMYTTEAADGMTFSDKALIGFPSFRGELLSSPTTS